MLLKSDMSRIWIIYLFSSPRKLGMRCFHLFPISEASRCPDLNTNVTNKSRLLSVHHLILAQNLLISRGHVQAPICQVIDLLDCEAALSSLNMIIEVKYHVLSFNHNSDVRDSQENKQKQVWVEQTFTRFCLVKTRLTEACTIV